MQSQRIILANEQRLLREMFRRVIKKIPDFKVVGEITDLAELPEMMERLEPQWVLVSLNQDGKLPRTLCSLLADYPKVRLLAMDADGSEVKIKWVETHEKDLGDLSLGALVEALRSQSPWELSVQP
jgi:DNA-binding NarL/FixJ family response regulator